MVLQFIFPGENDYESVNPDGNTLAITAASIDANLQVEKKNCSTLMWWRNWAQSLKDE